jgi:hypothetical protein
MVTYGTLVKKKKKFSSYIREFRWDQLQSQTYTDKKEKEILLIYKEIQMGSVAKSYMRKGVPTYRRKCANILPYLRGGR